MASIIDQKQDSIRVLSEGGVAQPKGFKAGGLHCGIKYKRPDLGWIYSEVPAAAAAVYTTNQFQAAPLLVTQESIAAEQKLQSVLVNSGIANACTGEEGLENAYEMRKMFAEHLTVPEHYAAVASTGVIGDLLPMEKISQGVKQIALTNNEESQFEKAILTTDTATKHAAVQININGKTVAIGGAAKGSGMIHPNMATMLAFITTDASVVQEDLLEALKEVTNKTFNMITVDGDTSTNDMVLLMANGLAENKPLSKSHAEWPLFVKGLTHVCQTLAQMIARDGEGATKLVEVHVNGAKNDQAAQAISKAVVGSNLVKTAIYGEDPNWGRIVCAVGYSGQPIDTKQIKVSIGPITIVEKGLPVPYSEQDAKDYLKQDEIQIFVDLFEGDGKGTAWGCDLSYDYVKINASYRT
ncbi:glutamate N-acetyltransferase/amino-acid N-acetyltransferase [Scopulibacillus daqui]|uniref:Arginine biosynthesis bifunctional protein ArgJ n=1 Tax=Scopulibacillus daqui TaxID=1469162 RepID=A0ABS2PWV3_9BACL|nr:bifunctional ornithine acetyltransferase/N-acetylglutamate synthase [Scopulibacillus daqui]MBM7644548.1 glutamate N-acetyltransferase/amino-acid N-acetyltransferase [Scopulibacillus daqui]